MNMSGHEGHGVMDTMMDHSSMDHSGHKMAGMDHSGHDMSGMDHSGHDMSGMDHSGHDMSGMGMHMDMGMMMYFHFGYSETILFSWWKISTIWELALSMLGICIMSFLYEALKYGRDYMFRKTIHSSSYTSTSKNNITISDGQQPVRMAMLSIGHCVQTLLHMVQFLVSYFLMLIFMTYNVWLCIAVLIGSGLGYFTFGWRKSVVVDITEHCH